MELTGEDDDGREEGVFGIVHLHDGHLFAETKDGLGRVTDAGHIVRISGVGQVVSEDDGIGIGVVASRAPQHHHFAGTGFEQRDLVLTQECVETGQPFGELDRQLHRQDRHFGYVFELGFAIRLVHPRRLI